MKELEKVMIEDVEYSYDPEKEYIKDGHAFCKVCHERKDGKVMEFFDNKMIFKISCKCDRDREEREKERQKQMEIERLKSSCFNSIIQWSYNFFNIHAFICDVIYKMTIIIEYRKGKYVILPIFSLEIFFVFRYSPVSSVYFLIYLNRFSFDIKEIFFFIHCVILLFLLSDFGF